MRDDEPVTMPIPRVDERPRRRPEPEPAHGHGHGHGPVAPASARVRRLLVVLLAPLAVAAAVAAIVLYPWHPAQVAPPGGTQTPVHGEVTATQASPCSAGEQPTEGPPGCVAVSVRMSDGAASGSDVRILSPLEPSTPKFGVGDPVVMAFAGGDPLASESYRLVDFQRSTPLVLLAVLFAGAVLLLGRWQGMAALAALGLSFVVLLLFVLPAIVAGENPLLVGVVGAGVIMFVVLYLTHGVTARTSTAVLGTLVSLALTGLLGALFSSMARLTGLDEDTSFLVAGLGHGIDTRGLLLAGVVIGALGVLDDVTVTQTSAVWELRRANPALSWRELYAAGLRIGRDHMSSAVNTLVMAYTGAALPVLLYSSISGVGFGTIITSQSIAQEIVRALVGSIGLIAAVPITTALAAVVAVQEPAPARVSRGSRRSG